MFTKFDKAGAAAIGTVIATLVAAFTTLEPESAAGLGGAVATLLTYFVPNKEA